MVHVVTAVLLGIIAGLCFRALSLVPIVAMLLAGLLVVALHSGVDFSIMATRMFFDTCSIELAYLVGAYLKQLGGEQHEEALASQVDKSL